VQQDDGALELTSTLEGTGLPRQTVTDRFPPPSLPRSDLLRPIYLKTAAYGHFGREEPEFKWESTDKAEALRADAGL